MWHWIAIIILGSIFIVGNAIILVVILLVSAISDGVAENDAIWIVWR